MRGWTARIREHLRRTGWRGVLGAIRARWTGRPVEVAARVPGEDRSVLLRLRTSDLWTFDGIFQRREYDVPLPEDPAVIVDAGANIGLASLYFAWRFPGARIVALEPEEANHRQLLRNVADEPGIAPVRAALWDRTGRIRIRDPGRGEWAFRTGEADPDASQDPGGEDVPEITRVDALTVDAAMARWDLEHIDILKLDIEGAEREVLRTAPRWIDGVGCIVAELHETLAPGAEAAFEAAVRDFPHRWEHGEYVVVSRNAHPWPGTASR